MFIERNTFHLKFGAGKEALRLWGDYLRTASEADPSLQARLLTDLTGDAYVTRQPGWKEFDERFVLLTLKGVGYRLVC